MTISCTKKKGIVAQPQVSKAYDTIYPQSYFPVYPGSTWKYLDQNNNIALCKTDSVYKLDHYTNLKFISDTFYVPFYQNTGVWGYEMHSGPYYNNSHYPFISILSETTNIGIYWHVSYVSIGNGYLLSRKVIARDTAIIVSGTTYSPTIVTEDFFTMGPPYYTWIYRRYYTKNIGLVKEIQSSSTNTPITTLALLSYTINN